MQIGITGATGFLGGHLARAFSAAGHAVRAFGRDPGKGRSLQEQGIRFLPADLRDAAALAAAFEGLDLVVHAAALSSVWGAYSDFYESNVVGTKNVIEACRKDGIRKLVYLSTSSVYFDFRDRFDISEADEIVQPSPSLYTRSKVEAERWVQAADGLDWIILRPRGIFGPGDTAIIPRVLRIARKGWFPIARNGEVLVDLTYVENLVQVLELCVSADAKAWREIYNVSNGEPIAIVDFFDQIMSALDINTRKVNTPVWVMKSLATIVESAARGLGLREPPITRYTAGLLCHHQTLDISKAAKRLGYAPRFSIGEGIDRTVASMRRRGSDG